MKRIMQITIVFGFVFLLGLGYLCFFKEAKPNQEQIIDLDSCYYVKDADGYVIVYKADQKTVFEDTSIPVDDLSEELQKELQDGIRLETIGQVYGFLENYSS